MTWSRLILLWTTLLALALAPASATARASVIAKTHVGVIDVAAALCIEAASCASLEEYRENRLAEYDGTSDVPHAARAGATLGKACFVAGTPVRTKGGDKPIEEVKVGDLVWSFDQEARSWGWEPVTHTMTHQYQGELVTLGNNLSPVTATSNHPFCVDIAPKDGRPRPADIGDDLLECGHGGRWVEAGKLSSEDTIQLSEGSLPVGRLMRGTASAIVYNLEVGNTGTYVVGLQRLLVHNKAAQRLIHFGDKVKAGAATFHSKIKPGILKAAGNFQHRVGKNPDIKVVGGRIQLQGTGPFKGKTFKTELKASDYFRR